MLKIEIEVMTSLIEKLDALCIKDDDERKILYGYIYWTRRAKKYFMVLEFFVLNASKNTLCVDKIKLCNMEDHKMSFMNLKRL